MIALGISRNPNRKLSVFLVLFFSLQFIFITGSPLHAYTSTANNNPASVCDSIDCVSGFYQTIDSDGKLVKYDFDGEELGFTQITTFGFSVNGTSYNILDDFFYTLTRPPRRLIRFSSDGAWTDLGFLDFVDNNVAGTFDNEGNYYVTGLDELQVHRIDVNTLEVTELIVSTNEKFDAADWVYIACENKLYGVGNDQYLYAFDPVDLSVTRTALTGDLAMSGHHGAAFTDVNGVLYVSNNASGNIYRVDVTSSVSTFVLEGPSSGTNDGASCPCALPPFPTLTPQDDEICADSDGQSLEIFLNDAHSFSELDFSSFEVITPPTNGTVIYTEETQSVSYQSNNPTVADSFVYQICLDMDEEFCEEAQVIYLPSVTTMLDESICAGEELINGVSTFTESGEYDIIYEASNGCDSIVTIQLEVFDNEEVTMEEEICATEEFVFDGEVFTISGIYEFNFSTAESCDSTVFIDLTVNPTFSETIEQTICEGEEYMFDTQIYEEEGSYTVPYTTVSGCDSIYTINLVVNQKQTTSMEEAICGGEEYELNGVTYTETGVYTQDLFTVNGCDSTLTLTLEVDEIFEFELIEDICEGGELVRPDGSTFSEEGDYELRFQTTEGCDSILNLRVNVLPNPVRQLDAQICSAGTFTLPDGTTFDEGGSYELNYQATNGCDSTLFLNLVVNDVIEENIERSICAGESVAIGDDVYTESGDYTNQFVSAANCDSIVNLKLTVGETYRVDLTEDICEGETYAFGADILNSSGIYEQNLVTSINCDSIIILELTVLENKENNISATICQGSTFEIGQESYNEPGEYTIQNTASNGCDSTVTLNLNLADRFETNLTENICEGESIEVGTEIFTETGIYEVLMLATNGCDSLVTLNLEKFAPNNVALDASICDGSSYTFGNDDLSTAGAYILELTNMNGCDSLVLLDLEILEVYELDNDQEICEGGSYEIGSSSYASAGIYFDTFTSANGCDSIIVTNLVVRENTRSEAEVFTCFEDQVGQEITVLSNSFGCDSTIVTNIVLLESSMSELEVFTCIEDQVGQEIVVLSNSFGCDSTVTTNTFLSPPAECFVVVAVDGLTIPCMESFGVLSVTIFEGTPPFTVNWSGPSGGSQVINSLGTFDLENLPPGNYVIEVIDANGNSTEEESEILEFAVPAVVADNPLNSSGFNIDCFGGASGAASVTAIGGEAPYTYLWSNGETSEEIQNLNSGIYSVTLTDANNCIDVTEVNITEPDPLGLDLDPIDLTCDDAQSGVVTIASSGGVAPYSYAINDSDLQSENTFIDLTAGDYSSLVVDANGCSTEGEFTLFMPTPVEVELGEDIDIDLGDIVQLQALLNLGEQDINTVSWSENLETNCPDCLLQTFTPTESGTYTIYVLDENGCESTDNVVIIVDTDQGIYAPNAFSPNGDGINDTFTLYSDNQFSPIISELHIYDRWGTEVFVNYDFPSNAEEFGWNGNFRGEPHNPGVFVYHATVEFIDGSTAFLKGDITLMQ